MRFRVLWTEFSSSSSLTQCLIFSSSAILRGIYSRVILFQFSPYSCGRNGPARTQFVDTNILSCWHKFSVVDLDSIENMSKFLSFSKETFFWFDLLLLILRLITMLKLRSWWSWYWEEIAELKIKLFKGARSRYFWSEEFAIFWPKMTSLGPGIGTEKLIWVQIPRLYTAYPPPTPPQQPNIDRCIKRPPRRFKHADLSRFFHR